MNFSDSLANKLIKTLIARGVCSFGLIFLSITISKLMGLAVLGRFSSTVALVLLVSLLSRTGSTLHLLKVTGICYPTKRYSNIKSALSGGIKRSFSLSLLMSLVVAFTFFYHYEYSPWLALLILCAPGVAILYSYSAVFRGAGQSYIGPITEIGFISFCVALSLSVLHLFGSVVSLKELAISFVVMTLLVIVWARLRINFVLMSDRSTEDDQAPSEESVTTLWSNRNYFMTELAQYFSQYGFVLVAAYFLIESDVALFTIVQQVAFIVSFILAVVVNSVSAKFAEYGRTNSFDMIYQTKRTAQKYMLFWLFPVGIIGIIWTADILKLFGVHSFDAIFALRLLIVTQIINALTGLSICILNMTGQDRIVSLVSIFVIIMQLIVSVTLATYFGFIGLIVALSATLLLRNALTNIAELIMLRVRKANV
jgi:O-antigen/teichoic acid export membrane protein